ncbi:haloacid dehalogenase superfamily, subfamily IA, variant 3 with third motif having DD or ED [Pseudomonas sp. NFPP07]|uniref:HAD family hydrolase n=1 Tax=Pseudomonas TaxID=286 RepID=UPI0008BF63A8|nr:MULTISPECIES: HAD-IA family hydrolase [Pseudomonas]AZD19001.1 Beta-phosphoglucomutase [Pseudomonas chlororaphis]MCP1481780.1 HAD superfamily hydrolase (TIGR01509 family) [Pseudomonas chlororaphis]MCP1597861.1 HAD superfamily hydrolase (TIGR01509 family) [Pseudomonas chlororaphis]PXX74999.1 HAD superfamily hydrolase (TIGR01509 family) [Pseudomonas sp. LAMO17WK12:I9]ROL75833.1 haloacid dehalogenase [Pseudomonas chlororaphis]
MKLSALLFDLDGTLIDTDDLHLNAYNQLLARWGKSMSLDYYKAHVMGFPDDMIFSGLFPQAPATQYPELAAQKEAMFRAQLRETIPVPGVLRTLDYAQAAGIPMAVVTNAPRENAEAMLQGLGIAERFDALVIGGELARGKPDPLPYLTALRLLDASADQALAFEDSLAGVRSAAAAGIHTFGMLSGLEETQLREAGARSIIRDFNDEALWQRLQVPA